VRSLGFTSSIKGEGKSFLAMVTAKVLANDSSNPVTLLECNWEHPSLHESFGYPLTPGLAEWLRGQCSETTIRHQVSRNLTFISAGDGKQDAVKLLQQIRQKGLLDLLAHSGDLLIVDLLPIMTTSYASLAASLVNALMVVVCAGVIPEGLLAEALKRMIDLPVEGIILNQVESRIPRWIRQIL
jgi:Mrp family chromosome partitioning ATPase